MRKSFYVAALGVPWLAGCQFPIAAGELGQTSIYDEDCTSQDCSGIYANGSSFALRATSGAFSLEPVPNGAIELRSARFHAVRAGSSSIVIRDPWGVIEDFAHLSVKDADALRLAHGSTSSSSVSRVVVTATAGGSRLGGALPYTATAAPGDNVKITKDGNTITLATLDGKSTAVVLTVTYGGLSAALQVTVGGYSRAY